MKITWKEASSVLNKYYPKEQREVIYKQKRLDSSETDTIKSNKIDSELLRAYALKEKDKAECEKIYQATDYYESEFFRQQCNQKKVCKRSNYNHLMRRNCRMQ